MKYETILFDWDGTLAETMPLWIETLGAGLERKGVSLTREQLVEACRGFGDYVMRTTQLSREECRAVFSEAVQSIAARPGDIGLYPGAKGMLKELKVHGVRMGLVTSSGADAVYAALRHHGIEDMFDAVISGDDVANYKPHTEPFEKIADIIPLQKSKTVMVGDRDVDIVGAHNYGIDSVLFYPHTHSVLYDYDELVAYRPSRVVADLRELLV